MKSKIITLIALMACVFAGYCQTNTAPAEQPVAAAAPAESTTATPASAETAATPADEIDSGAVIPLILMDDVPLTDAIRNLARQAELNYMLDPKIGYGQPGPDGKTTPQPMVALRWEKVTARQALRALLVNYSLQLSEDPATKIARITVKDPAAPDPLVTRVFQLKSQPVEHSGERPAHARRETQPRGV